MAAKEPDDDEVRKLIRECVSIVNEDRERAQYTALHERFGEKKEDPPEEPGEGEPPPAKEAVEEPKAEYGLWGKKKPR